MADDPLSPQDALAMTHFPPDPAAEEVGRRVRQTGQNLYNSWFGPAEELGRAAFSGTLDVTDPLTAGAALRVAPWAMGGRIPALSREMLEATPRLTPELAAHARKQAEYNFKLSQDEDHIAAVHHAMEIEDKAPHEAYYDEYLDHLDHLLRQASSPKDMPPDAAQAKYEDALLLGKITGPEFEGFMEALGLDKNTAEANRVRVEIERRQLIDAVRAELGGMRQQGDLGDPLMPNLYRTWQARTEQPPAIGDPGSLATLSDVMRVPERFVQKP